MQSISPQPEAWQQLRGPYILLPSVAGGKQEVARVEKLLAVCYCREWMAGNVWGTPRQACQVPWGWMRGLGTGRVPALPPGAGRWRCAPGRWRCAPGVAPGALPAGKLRAPALPGMRSAPCAAPGAAALRLFLHPRHLGNLAFPVRAGEGLTIHTPVVVSAGSVHLF